MMAWPSPSGLWAGVVTPSSRSGRPSSTHPSRWEGGETRMAVICQECGAPLPDGAECIGHFHALLLLEYEVAADPDATAGGRGQVAHFYAVSSYLLQHPEGMNYTAEALAGVRRGLADHLAGRVTISEQR